MSVYLGPVRLPEHDPDPETDEHRIPPGRWAVVGCKDAEQLLQERGLVVITGLTRMEDGYHGNAIVASVWGRPDGTPVVAFARWPSDPQRPCEHREYVLAPAVGGTVPRMPDTERTVAVTESTTTEVPVEEAATVEVEQPAHEHTEVAVDPEVVDPK